MQNTPVVADPEDVGLTSEPSNLLFEAIAEYEKSRPKLDQDEFRNSEEAWSLLANQVVGRENL